ncbi:MAG: hypothetical protein HY675_20040 [Chloroflexi bacterium]|nr:hypothetical protein [Chloroflexota bacterium]
MAFDANLVEATKFLDSFDGGQSPYPSVFFYVNRSPTIRFLAPRYFDGNWLREDTAFINLPGDTGRDVYYLLAPTSLPGLMSHYFPDITAYERPLAPDGTPAFTVYRVPAERLKEAQIVRQPVNAVFGEQLELVGMVGDAGLSRGLSPGKSADIGLLWRILGDTNGVYSLFVHLIDEKGRLWAQQDVLGLKVEGWRKGDLVLSRHFVTTPPDAPPIPMRVVAGAALKPTGERLRPATGDPGNLVKLRDTEVVRAGPPEIADLPAPSRLVQRELIPGLEVLGVELARNVIKVGEELDVEIVWRLIAPLAVEPLIEVRLSGDSGQTYARQEGIPAYGRYPFRRWMSGEVVRDPRSVRLTGPVSSARARPVLVAAHPGTGRRLGDLDLGQVDVQDRSRNYTLPAPQRKLDVSFDGQIRLIGYDLEAETVPLNGEVGLTLYWQAVTSPSRNYTVFTHLLDSGDAIVGQQDNPPVNGTLPTAGWAPGEVVVDPYRIKLKARPTAGEVSLEVGLYEPASGAGLTIEDTKDNRVLLERIKVRD